MQTEGLKLVLMSLALVLLTSSQILHMKADDKKIDVVAKADKKDINIEQVKISENNIENSNKPLVGILQGKEITIEKWYNIRISYYTISKHDTGSLKGVSASGMNLKTLSRGGNITYIAAPKNIDFNKKLFIEGIGICQIVDRGSAIKWDGDTMKIDIFVPNATQQELINMGVIYTKGYFIDE